MNSQPKNGRASDLLERVAAGAALVLLSPVLAAVAVAVQLEDGGPIFFAQERAGRSGRAFRLLKFRSMRHNAAGPALTAGGDSRVTRTGRLIRAYKLDELPQLWNVLRGDMSFIGPRPEVFRFIDLNDAVWQTVLSVKPGITDLATLVYRNEEQILAGASHPEQMYRERILPAKLALNVEYIHRRTLLADVRLLACTIRYSFWPAGFDQTKIKQTVFVSTDIS